MADGKLVMNPAVARAKAKEMTEIASELETLLNKVSRQMQEIDNGNTESDNGNAGMYQGTRKAAELRAELDSFRSTFNLVHEQIVKSANDITTIANRIENE